MNFAGAWARTTGHAYVGIADAPIWPYNSANLFDFGTTASPTIANPDLAWRAVFLTGLLPAGVGLLIRLKLKT